MLAVPVGVQGPVHPQPAYLRGPGRSPPQREPLGSSVVPGVSL